MPLPPPLPDPSHLETRLTVLGELLEKAVAEWRQAMVDLQGRETPPAQRADTADTEGQEKIDG